MGDLELESIIFCVVLFCVAGDRLSHTVETMVLSDAIPLLLKVLVIRLHYLRLRLVVFQ